MKNAIEGSCQGNGSNGSLMRELFNLLNKDPRFLNFFHNHLLDGLWYCDLTTPERQWISPRFWQLLGYPSDHPPPAEERLWDVHIHPEDREKCRRCFQHFLATDRPVLDQSLRFFHRSGKIIWLHCRALIMRDPGGMPIRVVGMYYDVTSYKELEQSVIDADSALIRRQQDLAHELQQPLATAIMLMETLKDTGSAFPEANDTMLADALHSLHTMSSLLTGLMQQASPDGDSKVEYIDIRRLIDKVARDLQARSAGCDATIHVHSVPRVQGNPILLRILFQNLIANAIKYRRQGTPPVIEISARDCQQYWKFAVNDNGIGIDERYHHSIFQRYTRAGQADADDSFGVGLDLCQKAVACHHGRIWVQSSPGAGSTFYFTLAKSPAPEDFYRQSRIDRLH